MTFQSHQIEDLTLAPVAATEQDPDVVITDHAHKRLKERLGLPKSARQRMVQKAFDEGWTHADARGRLKRFLDGKWLEHRDCANVRIFAEHLYFFAENRLVTVYEVPKNLRGGIPN